MGSEKKMFEKMKNLSSDGQMIFKAATDLMRQQLIGVNVMEANVEEMELLAGACVSTIRDVYVLVVEDELTPRENENDY